MKDNHIKVQLPEGQSELTIREGNALPPIPPTKVKLTGDIFSPGEYVKKRKEIINPLITNVVVNRELGSITLSHGDDTELCNTITGQLLYHPKFQEFGILSGKVWELEQLGKFLRKNRRFFDDRAENIALVNELRNFKGNVSKAMEKSNDDRGNKRHLIEQKIISNVPEGFLLTIPVFKGFPKMQFPVKINLESQDGRVVAWLESIEAEEMIEVHRDEIIDKECQKFADYVVIYS